MKLRTCTRIHEFDYGHRINGHTKADGSPGQCASLHGHRGKVAITCSCNDLDKLGMVIDFGKIKELVCRWIDDNLDHRMILNHEDPLLKCVFTSKDLKNGEVETIFSSEVFGPKRPYILQCNPTAENLAELIYHKAKALLRPYGIGVESVIFHETPNCSAKYREEGDNNPTNVVSENLINFEFAPPLHSLHTTIV